MIEPESIKSSVINVELAKTVLSQVLSSHQAASLQVPKHLCNTLSQFVCDSEALSAAQVAANTLNRDDTQTLVDLVKLVVRDLPYLPKSNLTGKLLCNVMDFMHIIPQNYRASGIQYDPTLLVSEYHNAKLCEGRVLKVRVCIANSYLTSQILSQLPLWANASHPNILPFHGVFHESMTESPQFCVVLPHLKNGTLEDYAPTLPQKSRMLLISDVVNGLAYLQNVLGQYWERILTAKGVMISDEGRALVVSFNANYVFFQGKTFESWDAYTKRFRDPLSPNSKVIWPFGCISYQVLSRKLPYYQVPDEQVYQKVYCGDERLIRPDCTDAEMDEIDDKAWELITKCCARNSLDRLDWSQIQEMLANMEVEEDRRSPATPLPIPEVQALRSHPEVDIDRAEIALNQAEVLHGPLSELIENHTKDVVIAVVEFEHDEIQTIVNFLDQITSSTLIFPQCYELRGIKHGPRKYVAKGGCGTVYQGADLTICIKLMKRFDTGTLTVWVKEVILWAHSSHPNVLPFLGVFLDSQNNPPQTCVVSPYMKNGNLRDFAAQLPQKSWLPLIFDVVNGLCYLHNLGVVHGDLKGENVLISDEGRGLITDFGMSHINMATAATGSLSLTMLHFSVPETLLGNRTPTKKFDIWSLGCLLYEEMPKRLSSTDDDDTEKDEYGWDDDIEEDYDAIDDQIWSLIVKCCVSEPEARPDIASVQELVVDMKIYNDRPAVKDAPGANILKSRVNPKIDLTCVEELFDQVKEKLAALPKNGSTDA
ncbi:Serine/threonine-protein kinase CTR1 [Leucoagaricus sp. SymC.cos]|nr:Serine/threonine-protein kinase CTR1 [Leucoagaricus sp. SymC.cos]